MRGPLYSSACKSLRVIGLMKFEGFGKGFRFVVLWFNTSLNEQQIPLAKFIKKTWQVSSNST